MRLRLAEPAQGIRWVRDGFRVFVKFPLAFSSVLAASFFAVLVLSLLPVVGIVAVLAVLPAGSLVFMVASRLAAAGQQPMPGAFIEVFRSARERRIGLVKLGLVYATSTLLILWLSGLVDGGALNALIDAMPSAEQQPAVVAARLADPRLALGLLLRLALGAVLSVPFWHAPALVHWGGVGWAKALFFSSVASWRNKGAFALYTLAWGAVTVIALLVLNVAVALLGQSRSALVAMPVSLVMATVFYATLYFSFADCFDMSTPDLVEPPSSA